MAATNKKEFNTQITDLLLSHGITIPEESKDGFFMSMMNFCKQYKEPKVVTEWWKELVEQYFEFYRQLNNGIDPLFSPTQGAALKKISGHLKRRFLKKRKTVDEKWTLELALKRHMDFYQMVCSIPRIKKLFSASFIYNNFDNIISELNSMINKDELIKNKLLA